ncbi:MAG: hypothetical protein JO199_02715 [Candidatus Eremiobacteraeota bacterium]|nr:hypothetical protein [Candidatus Eremiobacteraeota bacterium]
MSAYKLAALAASFTMFAACSSGALPIARQNAVGNAASHSVKPGDSTLHSFGKTGDGSRPVGDLALVGSTLYGATTEGGKHGCGTVFSVSTKGSHASRVIHSFDCSTDGNEPQAGLIYANGLLYGTCGTGGKYGAGTVFSVTPAGAYKKIYDFKGHPTDGEAPYASLTYYKGMLYGTTLNGGTTYQYGGGTVFSLSLDGKNEKMLHSFPSTPNDPQQPSAQLIVMNGKLYGTAIAPGSVFSIAPDGSGYKVLQTLDYYGKNASGLIGIGAKLYGISPDEVWTMGLDGKNPAVLYSFLNKGNYGSDVYGAWGKLILHDGMIYGTANGGGYHGSGGVFAITTAGKEHVVCSLGASTTDGKAPNGGLLYANNVLYGVSWKGGRYADSVGYGGTLYSCKP